MEVEGPPRGPGGVERPSRTLEKGREALPEVRAGLGSPQGDPPHGFGRGREALPKVWVALQKVCDALPEVQNELGVRPGGLKGVGRPSEKSRKGWESLREVRVGSRGPLGGPGWVGRPSQRSGSGWEALLVVQERSGGPPGGTGGSHEGSGGVGRPSRRSPRGLGGQPEGSGGVRRPYQIFRRPSPRSRTGLGGFQ